MPRPKKTDQEVELASVDEGKVEESPKAKVERVLLLSKNKFKLFSVGDEFLVENQVGQVLGRPATQQEGEKLVMDLNR